MFNLKNKVISTPPNNKAFTRLVNPSRSNLSLTGHSAERSLRFSLTGLVSLRPSGFTLAEVLITLVIIGVIAAITVPTLITKYQKEQTVTRLKKAYSALAQTTNRAITDNGPIKTWDFGTVDNTNDLLVFLKKYMLPYLSITKEPTVFSVGNWPKYYYYLNGYKASYGSAWPRFYLNDGTAITVRSYNSNNNYKRLYLYTDINGDKKPNKLGKDLFIFIYFINEGKLQPKDYTLSRNSILNTGDDYRCSKTTAGENCAALIMKDGWRIADDYPW